jgi:hypothetical protein
MTLAARLGGSTFDRVADRKNALKTILRPEATISPRGPIALRSNRRFDSKTRRRQWAASVVQNPPSCSAICHSAKFWLPLNATMHIDEKAWFLFSVFTDSEIAFLLSVRLTPNVGFHVAQSLGSDTGQPMEGCRDSYTTGKKFRGIIEVERSLDCR